MGYFHMRKPIQKLIPPMIHVCKNVCKNETDQTNSIPFDSYVGASIFNKIVIIIA